MAPPAYGQPVWSCGLEAAVRPEGRLRLGTALPEASRKIGLTNAHIVALAEVRDARPAEPMRFE